MTPANKEIHFSQTKRFEEQYAKAIRTIVKRALRPVKLGEDLSQWLAAITARSQQPDIKQASTTLAKRMVRWVNIRNARTWREASMRSQQSRKLYNLLQKEMTTSVGQRVDQLVLENALYISSIPQDVAAMVTGEIMRAAQGGARPKTLARMLRQRVPQATKARVRLIARTETAKASAALTRARCEALDVNWYIWRTSEDVRVRKSHKKMDGVLIPWSQAPDPEALIGEKSTLGHYHAGECPNCRCTQIVLLSPDDIKFPRRVYWNNAIRVMNKQDFLSLGAGNAKNLVAYG